MSQDSSANENPPGLDDLGERLRETIESIRAKPVPDGLSAKAIERATLQPRPRPMRVWAPGRVVSLAAAAMIMFLVGAAAIRYWSDNDRSGEILNKPDERQLAHASGSQPALSSNSHQPAAGDRHPPEQVSTDSSQRGAIAAGKGNQLVHTPHTQANDRTGEIEAPLDGRQPLGGQRDGAQQPSGQPFGGAARGTMAGASPSRSLAIARDATVFVASGGKQPIRMGHEEPWSRESTLHVWDWSKSDESRPLDEQQTGALAVSADGRQIAVSNGEQAAGSEGRLIDIASGKVERLANFDGNVRRLAFAPDGKTLILIVNESIAKARLRALELPSGKKLYEIEDTWSYTFAIAFTDDSAEMLLMDKDRFVRRYEVKTGKESMKYEPAHVNSIQTIAISSVGNLLASAGTRGDIHLWELQTGKLLHTLASPEQPGLEPFEVDSLAFSPDAKKLAGGGIFSVVWWDTDSGRQSGSLPRHVSSGAAHLRFSADGKEITAVRDFHGSGRAPGPSLLVYPSVRTWNIETGQEVVGGK